MKVSSAFLSAVCGLRLLLLLHAARVESARRRTSPKLHSMFVFGDSFADNGNLPRTDPAIEMSRQWYYPYGSSYRKDDGSDPEPNPTGRFSNYRVQSDFIAKMLGISEAPPAYQLMAPLYCDRSGMTFAFGGAGVYELAGELMTLGEQIDTFENLIKDGTIPQKRISHSVVLVAISGNDYARVCVADTNSFSDITAFIGNVTTEIAASVERLQNLGVRKVLVNNLHPIGCTPSRSKQSNYTVCDDVGNMTATIHNNYLKQTLGAKKNIFIVDLNTAFTNIINDGHHAHDAEVSELSRQVMQKLKPCCESFDPKGYCGQLDENLDPLYHLCEDPDSYFFWDSAHPKQAGWETVMKQLEEPIMEFLV